MLEGKLIPLTQGYFALVDAEDFERVSRFKWHLYRNKNDLKLAVRDIKVKGGRTMQRLYRVVMNVKSRDRIDFINKNGLDNRKSNLRICSPSQSSMKRRKQKGTSSIYKGVTCRKDSKKWYAQIEKDNKNNHLGSFHNEEEAAIAYNKAATAMFGEFARLNILEK